MVCAILEGRKTQTRRILKFPETNAPPEVPDRFRPEYYTHPCPYGQPGDRLWVRETWALLENALGLSSPSWCVETAYRASIDGEYPHTGEVSFTEGSTKVVASSVDMKLPDGSHKFASCTGRLRGLLGSIDRWRSSIHMPRWASRITLEVVSIRVERLQDISEEDAKAEGVDYQAEEKDAFAGWYSADRTVLYDTAKLAFQSLWQSINGPGSWDANPFVWVVEFKRITP